jgi:hypothetical protein
MIDSAVTDLNYRIDLADGDVRELLASSPGTGNIPLLLKYDQVRCMFDIIDRHADCIPYLVEDGYRKRESIC